MSEKLHPRHEHAEKLNLDAESKRNLERLKHKAESHESEKHEIDKIHKTIEQHAVSGKEFSVGEREHPQQQSTFGLQRELKTDAYKRSLKKIRVHLSPAERTLSKITHQPVIEKASEIGGKTIARPSGILGGGIVSFMGSATLLYLAKHYGFRYNFFVFILLFVCGFVLGMTLELVVRVLLRRRSIL